MKPRVIFVDDEEYVLQGLKRMLRDRREQWDMDFVLNGQEALELMAVKDYDLIISDMIMPGMNGAQLLQTVMERYPHTVRMVLSGNMDREMNLLSAGLAHQYISKPVYSEGLKTRIDQVLHLKELLGNEHLLEVATRTRNLPSIPQVFFRLVNELHSAEPSVETLSKIISQDLFMTARILNLVNSAFFGLPQKVRYIKQAVALLGLENIKSLVLQVGIFCSLENNLSDSFQVKKLCKHSSSVGALAKRIAARENADEDLQNEAMVAGTLHDIGYAVLLQTPEDYRCILEVSRERKCTLLEAENEIMGVTHAQIGAFVLGIWGLSCPVVKAVIHHHDPAKSHMAEFSPTAAVHVAECLASSREREEKGEFYPLDLSYLESINRLGSVEAWREIAEKMFMEDRWKYD